MASAESFLAAAIHHQHGTGKPAAVVDIDDTLLNTYARHGSAFIYI